VVLTGARQAGKSTLLLNAEPFHRWRFHTMDDSDKAAQAIERPGSLWADTQEVVLDEVQKTPGVLAAVKQAVDTDRSRRFVLSGSANLLLMRQVSESLAGRAVYFVLDPMSLGEVEGRPETAILTEALAGRWPAEEEQTATAIHRTDPIPWLLRGFLPGVLTLEDPQAVLRWWEGYVATYLERDLRQLSQVASLVDFRRLMELLALRSGQLLNQSELGRDARLSQATVHRYLNLLEATHLFERLPALTRSRTARLVKSPRPFWIDPGLATFLCGHFDAESVRNSSELGFLFETLIFLHLRILCARMTPKARLYNWRTQRGDEVDFVVEHGRRLLGVEVKLAKKVGFRQTAGLRCFLEQHPEASGGLVIYNGERVRQLDENIFAVPWTRLTGEPV
jgi:predicted AAA+ superfamily ATPase